MTHRGSRGEEPGGWDWEWVRTKWRGPPRAQSLKTAAEPSAPAADAHVVLAIDVRRALAELSEGNRRLLLARYRADMTQREVADLLGMPDGTAKVRLHRLRARLRPTLLEE
jgi:DNA-directed RNA polymerase specialized sigma24 family protein